MRCAPPRARIDGDTLTIDRRQKSYVTGGAQADFVTALVEIEGARPRHGRHRHRRSGGAYQAGLRVPWTARTHAWIEFANVRVPAAHIVGKPGEGLTPGPSADRGYRASPFAAESVGLMRWVLDYLTVHLAAPHRSGPPLGSREGVRLRYADLRIKAYAARSMVYRTARLADAGENTVNEAIACKVFATEALGEVVDTAIQLIGGRALTVGHPLETLYRRVRVTRLAEGANDVLRLNLARGRLDLEKGRI